MRHKPFNIIITMAKKSNIYTKTGDNGETALVGGQRVSKTHVRLEAYGTVDELNAQVGVLITYVHDQNDRRFLYRIQQMLFVVGSYLATDTKNMSIRPHSIVTTEMVNDLEEMIDRIDAELPPLRLFIVPSGTRGAASAHVCRTVCRRAERCIYRLAEAENIVLDDNVQHILTVCPIISSFWQENLMFLQVSKK